MSSPAALHSAKATSVSYNLLMQRAILGVPLFFSTKHSPRTNGELATRPNTSRSDVIFSYNTIHQ